MPTIEEVAKRRRELFPPVDRKPYVTRPPCLGTTKAHCDICPKSPGEDCGLTCSSIREAFDALQNDNIKISY